MNLYQYGVPASTETAAATRTIPPTHYVGIILEPDPQDGDTQSPTGLTEDALRRLTNVVGNLGGIIQVSKVTVVAFDDTGDRIR